MLTKEGHCVSSILEVQINGINEILKGTGIGPIDACLEAINKSPKLNTINIIDYSEHALQTGSEAQAIASVDKARAAVDKTTEKSIEVRRILDEFPTNEYIEKDIKQKVENANIEANEADITAKNALLEAEAAINIANRKKNR